MSPSAIPAPDPAVAFYDALAPMFDVMTDWEARLTAEGPFLAAQLEAAGARRVLDFACGSGGHALWLAERGYAVAGVDVSPAMIRLARQKAQARGADVPFEVVRPGEEAAVPGAAFDAVICLGNSLPHLLTQDALVAALHMMAHALRPGGVLILQNLNYDLRWVKQPRWFAAQGGELAGQPVLVWRFADYDVPAGRIYFHIALFRRIGVEWTVEVHTTPQRPLFRADLLAALVAAGFEDVQAFGRMALPAEPFEPDRSGDLVMVARRSAAG
ncbi:MAG: class I SAM-dependent methyltransferase [Anaerolineae bacterium]